MQTVKIGILGSGAVGKALATGFASLGHPVTIGSRTAEKLQGFADASGGKIKAGTFEEAASSGDIVVLATLGTATREAIDLAGRGNFRGKVVIDTTNPLRFPEGGLPQLAIGFDNSLGEEIQRWIPDARVVKAFNTVGNAQFVHPDYPDGPPTMFICGNDDGAKKIVSQICEHFGWGVADIGAIEGARYLEPMCITWVWYGIKTGGWGHAFKLLKK